MTVSPMDLDVPVPPRVAKLAAGRRLQAIWHNELGGLTYRVGADTFVKWSPHESGLDLTREAERLAWAVRFTPVPVVLDCDRDDDGQWLVTAALPGEYAVSDRWKQEPRTAVTAIANGLRAMHDAMPVAECPFTWARADRVGHAFASRAAGKLSGAPWHEDYAAIGLDAALRRIIDPPPDDKLVVCHGDACSPNTLIGDDGRWTAHVDLGELGIADRWADLAVASWALTWNYEGDWQGLFFDTYGVAADRDRIDYYRLLWELTP
ncbi:MAG TPA: aminoglycoside 3'-phosphotransferase [Micromonosporaceae bacterium]|nr:aminoglycoside 3'-phosphotransferase [Micromonosporaceae bacterium]